MNNYDQFPGVREVHNCGWYSVTRRNSRGEIENLWPDMVWRAWSAGPGEASSKWPTRKEAQEALRAAEGETA